MKTALLKGVYYGRLAAEAIRLRVQAANWISGQLKLSQ